MRLKRDSLGRVEIVGSGPFIGEGNLSDDSLPLKEEWLSVSPLRMKAEIKLALAELNDLGAAMDQAKARKEISPNLYNVFVYNRDDIKSDAKALTTLPSVASVPLPIPFIHRDYIRVRRWRRWIAQFKNDLAEEVRFFQGLKKSK